jgi:hypothetical protein
MKPFLFRITESSSQCKGARGVFSFEFLVFSLKAKQSTQGAEKSAEAEGRRVCAAG